MRNFIYKDLIELGFNKFTLSEDISISGYEEFYLHFKIKNIEFEWFPEEFNEIRMVRYKNESVQNYIMIQDMESLKMMIDFFTKNETKKETRAKLSKANTNYQSFA